MFVDSALFRQGMQRLGASVTVITTAVEGAFHGMTATAVCSVSTDPPSLLICVNRDAGLHDPIRRARCFCVNILGSGQVDLAARFSSNDEAVRRDRFAGIDVDLLKTGAPAIRESLAQFDCDVIKEMECKTHTIFFGMVKALRVAEAEGTPLVYMGRRYGLVVPLESGGATG